jgi:large subunit ribosomal protein L10
MKREEKAAVVEELASRLSESQAVFAIDYRGITVSQAAELRAKLREADATFKVVKNRLAKRSAEQAGIEGLDEYLSGPTALTLVKGDAVVAAKAITEFNKEHEVLEFRGGLMDGTPLDPDGFKRIARLPGVDVLRGRLVGITASPLTGLVTSLNNLVAGLGRQLSQIAEQGLVGGEAGAEEKAEEAKAEESAEDAKAEEAKPEGEEKAEGDAEEAKAEGDAEEAKAEGDAEEAKAEGDAEAKAEGEEQAEAAEETSEAPQASEQDDESEGSADGSAQEGEDAEGSDETAQED